MPNYNLPYYIDVKTVKQKLNISRARLDKWVKSGKLKYCVFSSDKRAKKIFVTQDILNIVKDHEVQI